jgi:transcriptional regulator with XRE-family HTH domain
LLRYWRQERGKSQLDLSMDTGISHRHLSFVESGRSSPSRDFLSGVSDALNIPLRERNALLLASGFAPQYSEQRIDADQMAIVTQAIDRMLQQHEPHPALVLDRYWNIGCAAGVKVRRGYRTRLLKPRAASRCGGTPRLGASTNGSGSDSRTNTI